MISRVFGAVQPYVAQEPAENVLGYGVDKRSPLTVVGCSQLDIR